MKIKFPFINHSILFYSILNICQLSVTIQHQMRTDYLTMQIKRASINFKATAVQTSG